MPLHHLASFILCENVTRGVDTGIFPADSLHGVDRTDLCRVERMLGASPCKGVSEGWLQQPILHESSILGGCRCTPLLGRMRCRISVTPWCPHCHKYFWPLSDDPTFTPCTVGHIPLVRDGPCWVCNARSVPASCHPARLKPTSERCVRCCPPLAVQSACPAAPRPGPSQT